MLQLKQIDGVDNINYLTRKEVLNAFYSWCNFGGAMDMLEQYLLPTCDHYAVTEISEL